MTTTRKLAFSFWLALLAYLGFYFYALVMGVFSPGEMPFFTTVAVVSIVAIVFRALRPSAPRDAVAAEQAEREEHRLRESRGF